MTSSIVLGAFDKYGHQTLPRRGHKWVLSSTGRSGVFSSKSEFTMQTDGSITITGLSPNVSSRKIPEEGLVIEEHFELKQASAATETWAGVPSIPISFRIFPQKVPAELRVSKYFHLPIYILKMTMLFNIPYRLAWAGGVFQTARCSLVASAPF
jgi:hypothetical protein